MIAWLFSLIAVFYGEINNNPKDLMLVIGEAEHRIPLGASLKESMSNRYVLAIDIPSLSCGTCANEKIKTLALLCEKYNLGVVAFVREGYSFQYVRNLHKLTGLEATFLVLDKPAFALSNNSGLISMALFSKEGRILVEPCAFENANCISSVKKISEKLPLQ